MPPPAGQGFLPLKRPIAAFRQDAAGDWIAELACGHARHVRHTPPWQERAWVVDPEQRAALIGTPLDCVACDRRELPVGWVETRRTRSFAADSIPAGLLRAHTTRAGVWAHICVTSGALDYHIGAPFHVTERLAPGRHGVVLPEVEHEVAPCGAVAFHVRFFARAEV